MDVKEENTSPSPPKGIKYTGMALIALCGLQVISWNVIMVMAASALKTNIGDFVIYSSCIFGSIVPVLGVITGIGVYNLKAWGKTMSLLFSIISILLYSIAFALVSYNDPAWRYSLHIVVFPGLYLLGLPIWSLYYFTRPQTRQWFDA